MDGSVIVACVHTGTKYGKEYVDRLRRGVSRYLGPFDLYVFNDAAARRYDLQRWWLKMALFEPSWRAGERVLYLDLDTVVVGSLEPLAEIDDDLAMCTSFAPPGIDWKCKYSSAVMVLGTDLCGRIWEDFNRSRADIMHRWKRYGDQYAIQRLCKGKQKIAPIQERVGDDFFLSPADDMSKRTRGCSLVIFGGRKKPHDDSIPQWIRRQWIN